MTEKLMATWSIRLDTECPACKEDIDLLSADSFWECNEKLMPIEHNTPRSTGMEVGCPKCGHEFKVDLEY
jgi:ribosomal protein S27E